MAERRDENGISLYRVNGEVNRGLGLTAVSNQGRPASSSRGWQEGGQATVYTRHWGCTVSEAMRHDREENKQGSLTLSRSRAGTILQPWFNSVIFKLRFILLLRVTREMKNVQYWTPQRSTPSSEAHCIGLCCSLFIWRYFHQEERARESRLFAKPQNTLWVRVEAGKMTDVKDLLGTEVGFSSGLMLKSIKSLKNGKITMAAISGVNRNGLSWLTSCADLLDH